jgi:hypothetical protein
MLLAACASKPADDNSPSPMLDLGNPDHNLLAFAKARASLDPQETVVFYWTGHAYSLVPGERQQALFVLEGFNIARLEPIDGGYQLLSREIMVYKDPKTREILHTWLNPFTQEENRVFPVANNPVNARFALKGDGWEWGVDYEWLAEGRACLYLDVHLLYPSPLPASKYPQHARSEQYQASELFQFFVDMHQVSDPDVKNAAADISWTRLGEWLPWMEMGNRPGYLLYQCRGFKAPNGLAALSPELRSLVEQAYPQFMTAPEVYTAPNQTTWSNFKTYLEAQTQQ